MNMLKKLAISFFIFIIIETIINTLEIINKTEEIYIYPINSILHILNKITSIIKNNKHEINSLNDILNFNDSKDKINPL